MTDTTAIVLAVIAVVPTTVASVAGLIISMRVNRNVNGINTHLRVKNEEQGAELKAAHTRADRAEGAAQGRADERSDNGGNQ